MGGVEIIISILNNVFNLLFPGVFQAKDSIDEILNNQPTASRDEVMLYLIYISSGAKTVVLSWLNGEIKGSPSEIAKTLSKLIQLSQKYFD